MKTKIRLSNKNIMYSILNELKPNHYATYMSLLIFKDEETNECKVTYKELSKFMGGISERSIKRYVKDLVDKDFIVLNSGKQGNSNSYYFPKEVYFKKDIE